MFLVYRAIAYATLFIACWCSCRRAFLLLAGIGRPVTIAPAQVTGMVVGLSGAALALWCIVTFLVIGRGTPAPFDPPFGILRALYLEEPIDRPRPQRV